MSQPVETTIIPGLTAGSIPGEWLVERSATIILSLFLTVIGIGVVTASLVSMNINVDATGGLEPRETWTVRPLVGGLVTSVAARTGAMVQAGDLLFTIDSTLLSASARDLATRLATAKLEAHRILDLRPIDLRVARERARLAEASVDRARIHLLTALIDNGRSPDVDSALRATQGVGVQVAIDLAKSEVRQAEGELRVATLAYERLAADSSEWSRQLLTTKQLAVDLDQARGRLLSLQVRAPAAGIVLTDHLEFLLGRVVRDGETALEIGAVGGGRVDLQVPETNVRKVEVGQQAELTLTAQDITKPIPLSGRVVSVAPEPPNYAVAGAASGALAVVTPPPTYRVVVALDSGQRADGILGRRGFTVRARIRTGRQRVIVAIAERLLGSGRVPF